MNEGRTDSNLNSPWEIEETGQKLPLLDYLQLLWFRRKLILAITIFAISKSVKLKTSTPPGPP